MSLDASRLEAQEKERMGDTRQSYEPTAKVGAVRGSFMGLWCRSLVELERRRYFW